MSDLNDFPWPRLPGGCDQPRWQGDHFKVGTKVEAFLQYDSASSGWTDELTQKIELESGEGSNPIDRASRQMAIDSFAKLPAKAIVLEAGSSSGYLMRDLRKAYPAAQLIASDYLAVLLDRFSKREPHIPAIQFDLQNCPLPDACIDGFAALNVLEHIDDDRRCLQQINRILKPGGIVHLEVPYGPQLYDIYDEFVMHKRRYLTRDFSNLVRDSGFSITKATCLGFFVYPYFRHLKKRGQKMLQLDPAGKQRVLAGYFKQTKTSRALQGALTAERILGHLFRWPVGVRCVVVAQKS